MATRKPAADPPAPARSESSSALAALHGQQSLAQLVHLVRGEKVLLDADLAMLYGVETGALNRAVKSNLYRFPADFMFPLSAPEWENLRCQIGFFKCTRQPPRHALGLHRTRRGHALQRVALP